MHGLGKLFGWDNFLSKRQTKKKQIREATDEVIKKNK